jgi:hypothetical protein
MFFCDGRWPSMEPFCREKSTCISPSSYPFENHALKATFLAIFSLS